MKLINKSSVVIDAKITNVTTGETFEYKLTEKGSDDAEKTKTLSSDFTYRVAVQAIGQAPVERNNVTSDADVTFSINNGLLAITVNAPTKA